MLKYKKTGIKRFFVFFMQHIIGISRQQLCFSSLEDTISPDNQVRFIAFVESVDLSKLDFAKRSRPKTSLSFSSKPY
jgi:hypothetical protein